jgi:hypothetical protein
VPCKVCETKISAPVCLPPLSLLAHTEAFENARILHCNISAGNVIISDRGGLLIDWDLSKDIEDLQKISQQPFRTVSLLKRLVCHDVPTSSSQGTWQFIAARLLQARESAAHTPADDWESFFHVLRWVVLRFTKHGLDSAQLMHELRNTYDDSYVDGGEIYGGENKEKSIKSWFISSRARILPGPLLDLLKDLVDICAVRYEDPPPREDHQEYELFLQDVARDSSLERFADKYPFKCYQDCREKLKASWLVERFREAVNSQAWNMGPEGQHFENPLTQVDEVAITTKCPSEFEPDMPRQSKRFKPMLDSDDMDMGETSQREILPTSRRKLMMTNLLLVPSMNMRWMITQWWPDAMRLKQTGKVMRTILLMTSFQNK